MGAGCKRGYKKTQDKTALSLNQIDFLKDMRKRDKKVLTIIEDIIYKISSGTISKDV